MPAILSVAMVAIGFVYEMGILPYVLHRHGYVTPADAWIPMKAAHFIGNGAYLYQYESSPYYVTTPMWALLMSPLAAIGDALKLTEGGPPIGAPYPQMWWLYGPLALGSCVVYLWVVGRIDRRLASSRRPTTATVQVALAVLVVVPGSVVYGHYEDIVAVALVLLCIGWLLDANILAAGLALGFAAGFKQWALLTIPLFVLLTPRGERMRGLFWSVFPPAALVAGPLLADPEHAVPALLHAKVWTTFGRPQLWIDRSVGVVSGSVERMFATVGATASAWFLRGRTRSSEVLGAFGLVLSIRVLFEPTLYAYYLAPALTLFVLAERARGDTGKLALALGATLDVLFLLRPPMLVWWLCFWPLLGALAWPAIRDLAGRTASRERPRVG